MEFDEWEKMKEYEEGRGAYQGLYDGMKQTVNNLFEGISNYICDSCNKVFMSGDAQCSECGSWNTRKI
ncbi:MAG: hypothetical protein FWC03_07565 [Treponema sp.]|nr:hypothetical protein [Treponema sp.]